MCRRYKFITRGGYRGRILRDVDESEIGYSMRNERPRKRTAVFAGDVTPGPYHLLLDGYTQYVPFEMEDVTSRIWTASDYLDFPTGLKHGSVTPLTQSEYDAVAAAYGN
ncbi:hypothetical protein AC579_2929 [Pseudocercospora musae]|uniref:Uncharacterized protein n=1 Tax=Pseudocercospora musae TaxID=113226 RepID=A0A139IU36_9PEZI|nr:hypothetical protein AC579_2929 [Pseudocercospora musae]